MTICKIRCAYCGHLAKLDDERYTFNGNRDTVEASLENGTFKCPKCKYRMKVRLKDAK